MKASLLLLALALAVGIGLAPAPLLAANADQPYQNVDKRNDAGNSTGNGQVERLNNGQLDQNQPPPAGPGATASTPSAAPLQPEAR
jgi:hypothetical protein